MMFEYLKYIYTYRAEDRKPKIVLLSQDEIRTQLRNPTEKKPDGYKNTNTSSIRLPISRNLTD